MSLPEIVGAVVADIARSALSADPHAQRPALRISGFDEAEVVAMAAQLRGFRLAGAPTEVVVKVGTTRDVTGLRPSERLAPGETLTRWRNADVSALILIDLDPQGDEEGLAALNRLDDQGVLADDDDVLAAARFGLVVRHAWEEAGRGDTPPGRLNDDLNAVRDAFAESHSSSLRKWTAFVRRTALDLGAVELLTPDEVDHAVGSNLWALGLFPDELLFADDRAVRTRLVRNVRVSELRQPSGTAIAEDDLLGRIDGVDFDEELLAHFGLEPTQLRSRMRRVVEGGGAVARSMVDLSLWLELFERRADQAGLGQLVRENIAATAPPRVDEFERLDVEAGLDHSEQEAAERLLRAEPPAGEPSLTDLLAARLRRRIEKLAFPDAQLAADPLRALLHGLHVLEDVEGSAVHLGLEGAGEGADWSRWLFALLYGATLADVVERTSEARRQLTVDARLVTVDQPEFPAENDEFDLSSAWSPLRLTIEVADGSRRRFRWDPLAQPGLIAFAALLHSDAPARGAVDQVDLDAYCERYIDPRNWSAGGDLSASTGTVSDAMRAARVQAVSLLRSGVSADRLDDYVTSWSTLADQARAELVPANAPMPELADVVLTDVIELGDNLAMLATHPLRLRWISRHLRRMTDLLVRGLTTGLALNPENTELFFEWLDRASPHGTPPFVVGDDETVAIAVREYGWHEEYAAIRRGGHEERDWLASVDDAAIDEMVSVVTSYLDTYPYKRDGIVLLLLSRDGAPRLPLRLVQRARLRSVGVRIEVHVLAPQSTHHDIVRAFEDAFVDDELTAERLFPDVQLVVRHWDGESEPLLDSLKDRVDIALAPALFGTRTNLNRHSRDPGAGLSGAYDPWLHAATHDLAENSQNVVRVMLPQQLDPILETWSTLCVRHYGHSVVAPQQEANTDYFALQVRFDRHQRLFAQLHEVAHWVVTLDAFVGRDQIDALDERPDVILVRTGVGKNEAYTLIVSSATGRRFVVQRLTRKLRFDLGFGDRRTAEGVAERLYEVGRHVVPGVVLRALGLGRAANEVVGLVLSRFEVARRFPVEAALPGLEVWISFDEHMDWFGRTQRTRADLGRFVLTVDDDADTVRLDILVVESKFRRSVDVGTAERQLDRTTDLCEHAFSSASEFAADDTEFWRQELAAAIEQTSRVDVDASELPARRRFGPQRPGLEDRIIQSLRTGDVTLTSVAGVAVAIATDVAEPGADAELGRHGVIRIHRPDVDRIIDDLRARRAPVGLDGEHPATSDPPETGNGPPSGGDAEPDPGDPPAGGRDLNIGPVQSPTSPQRGLGADQLRSRYERLLDVLRQHNVAVDPPPSEPWREGPGFFVMRVIPRPGVTVDRVVNRVDEISLALALPAGDRIRTSLDRGTIVFEVPKSSEDRYGVSASSLWDRCEVSADELSVPLGEDLAGSPVSLTFSSPDSPHLLVAGTTGSGKSVALETLLRGLCRYDERLVRLQLIDPKGTELVDFADDPHTDGDIGMDGADAISVIETAVAEMQRRYQLMRPARARSLVDYNQNAAPEERLPWHVLVLDEYADLTSDPDDKTRIEQGLRRLTQKARAAGIHVIVATQRPSADVVSTTIRSNFPAQLALRVKTATDSRIIMDEPGAEALAGQGDAFLRTARGVTRLQVARLES